MGSPNCETGHRPIFRFVDEALAADFMSTFQSIMERPEFMNLGLVPIVRKDRAQASN